ncbi:MAG: hypothetical protein H7Z13_10610 [Ferruginibacter sp.]|nr:hypothetical protein [Ferruginibacter sp.]
MPSAICTLFEGHYHYGLAALANSLYKEGFRGSIYVGFRGDIPPWASAAKNNPALQWRDASTLEVADGMQLHFLPVDTDYHLTNYKPDFMLKLWDGPAADAKRMFYFDPDIVVVRSWLLFEEWVTCGVALSEDVNSPLSKNHPRRVAWRRYFGSKGIPLNFRDIIYVNGGFIGLSLANRSFLDLWKKVQETMAPFIGGLNRSIFKADHLALLEEAGGPFSPFVKTDQDALNATVEAWDDEVSFISKEGMGFESGFILMYHALGDPKPWRWKPMRSALDGRPPRMVDIQFWNSVSGPIVAKSEKEVYWHKFAIKMTAGIGRFYKRN